MLRAYIKRGESLVPRQADDDLAAADWIDLYRPLPEQVARVDALGVEVPTLDDMSEIEITSRLYQDGSNTYMTAMLPGLMPDGEPVSGPVTFILNNERLITVRHHAPRPFDTFAEHAARSASGTRSSERLFLGLIEEIIARQADLLEAAGKVLDDTLRQVFRPQARATPASLQSALQVIGQESDQIARIRLALLSLDRVLTFHSATLQARPGDGSKLKVIVRGHQRDLQALLEHADFLSSRVSLSVDATIGMINLQQSDTVRVLSVVAALFLPPTLVASIYGMNFDHMPELHWKYGYEWALGLMVLTVLVSYLLLRWKNRL